MPLEMKFVDFMKSVHMKLALIPMSSIHVKRNGKKITDTYRTTQQGKEERDRFVLENRDVS